MKHQFRFEAIGTHWLIAIETDIVDTALMRLKSIITNRIDVFDRTYSRFRKDSFVWQLQAPGTYPMPADGYVLFSLYKKLYDATSGRVTPLIGTVLSDAGYDADYSFKSSPLTSPPTWEDALTYTEKTVIIKRLSLLDMGAAGKGYLVDIIGELLENEGISDYTINAGGDIRRHTTQGTEATIGLEHPLDFKKVIAAASLGGGSFCASSGSRRKWGNYHHIIDPVTLESPTKITATWVLAQDAMTADGLATALFFVSPSILQKSFDFSYALLGSDMQLEYSSDFPVEVYA